MIYRILVDERGDDGIPTGTRLGGIMVRGKGLENLCDQYGVSAPRRLTNAKARFYFTEAGWKKAGRLIAAAARQRGFIVHCVRRKNPDRSQVVYRDRYQAAILPLRGTREGGPLK